MLCNPFARLTITMIAAAFCGGAAAPQSNDELHENIVRLRDRFVGAVRHCGVTPQFVPPVIVASTPAVISYDGTTRTIVVGRWEPLPPPIQAFFTQWAAQAYPRRPARFLFDTLFNDFLVGHELGHWAADQSNRPVILDHYDAEIEANRYAIAFSNLRHPRGTARIVDRFAFLNTLPNPVPAGEDSRNWFNKHYDNLARTDPLAYNWYQGVFMRKAWTQRQSGEFCNLANANDGK